ncbi:MAG: hypothetical protein H6Q32_1207 [Bacteroidetes bacterium]|nr:hypothetical protein [Bacteroidota bacterium]
MPAHNDMSSFSAAAEKLEFAKVKQRVLRYAVSDAGRDLLENAPVLSDTDDVRDALAQVTAMKRLLEVEDALPRAQRNPEIGR